MIVVSDKNIFLKSLLIFQILLCAGKLLAQPVANFSATPLTGCAPLAVQFTDLSTGNPTSWKWDLGNGTTPSNQNPQTTYFTPGLYKITLTVKNASGSNTIVKDQYINVQFNPTAKFIGSPVTGCLPLTVQFTDQSTATNGTVSAWKWDFGDGYIDSVPNPKHVYTTSGTFDVTLQVKNNSGCPGAVSQIKYINTSNSVTADFTNNVQNSCKPPINLTFQNLSTGPSLSYKWDFGDGGTSTVTNPTHPFSTAGNFPVKLTTTSAGGCSNTVQKNIVIGTVSADFAAPLSVCPGKPFSFINASSPSPSEAFWNFGDGTTSDSLNPVKTYSTPGNYTIKLVSDFGACKDSITKSITVIPKQKLAFTVDDSASCKAPFTVNFSSNVPGATSYFWNFGDGSPTSNLPNPSHTYFTTGSFNITFITTNSLGCSDTLVRLRYIKVQAASVTLPDLPQKNCVPFTYTFSANINSVDPVTGYSWNFGDGSTSNLANPVHTFSVIGSYNISVTVTTANGCVATTQVLNGIIVGNKPVANFSGSPRQACASTPIDFTDLSTGVVTEWLWDFGDSTYSSLQNPSHNYNDTGNFKVKLLVRSNGCPDSISFSNYIHIKPATSKFYIKANCALPLQKGFVDSSKGANTWEWDFGDNSPKSNLRNPKHIYADTGTYSVSLTVTNLATGCEHTSTKKALVIIENAMYAADATNICKNSSAVFRQQNINSSHIKTYNWQFGDESPNQSNVDSVSHKYLTSGMYTTRLIITDLLGCQDTLIKPKHITVQGPTAKYTSNVPGACINNSIDFIDGSLNDGTHPIVQWLWDYGDNTTDILSGPPFRHTYTKTGTFTVKLKVRDSNGCEDSLVKVNNITISKPVANFTTKDSASCPMAPVQFTSLANSSNLVYLWNFGDGNTSNNPNPLHQYVATGTFTVSLKITDQFGCSDSLSKTNYVTITTPLANFSLSDSVSACPPFFVTFVNSSLNFTTLSWDFGDGGSSSSPTPTHYYYLPGNYIVKLRATGPGGCFSEKTSNIIVKGPQGVLSYTNLVGCNTLRTDFKATAKDNLSFTWDFNDGTTVKTTDSSISHVYTDSGYYLPKLILEDASGCQVPILGTDTVKVIKIEAEFDALQKVICDQGSVTFSDSSLSNDNVTKWTWNFGDGSTALQQNPSHSYAMPGLYNVSLIAASSLGCADTITKSNYLKIIARPDINITGPAAACAFDTLNFHGIFLKPDSSIVTWKWDFGNGQTSFVQDPQAQKYSAAGNYNVIAMAINSSGCVDTATKAITINPLPFINAGNDAFLCLGTPLQLQASGANAYQWISRVNFLSCLNCSNPLTSTPDDITYIVRGTSGLGCIALDSVNIGVKKPFTMTVTPNADSVCLGQSVQLNASIAENYLWTPGAGLNNATIQSPAASPDINTTYKVVGYDSAGCFKDSAFVNVSVFGYPAVDAGSDKTIKLGKSIQLSPVYSEDVVKWLWTTGSGLNCTTCPDPLATPVTNTKYTIQVENNGGCLATDDVTIFVVCNNENIFIPNTFSPNGDGANDVFYPRGTGLNRIRGMKIFNRWGQVVFEKSNFYANDAASGWDGRVGGKEVPADVYTFVIDIICDNGDLISQSGNVALLK